MGLTREERQLLHQKSKQPTFGSGKPDSNQGNEGDIAYRQVEDSGLVQYVKQNGSWVAVGSQGDMPETRDVTRTVSSGGGGVGSHNHGEFIKKDGSVAYTGNQSFGSNNITNVGTLDVDGATTLDQVTINTTDGAFAVSGANPINLATTGGSNHITINSGGTLDVDARIVEIQCNSDYTAVVSAAYSLTGSGNMTTQATGSSDNTLLIQNTNQHASSFTGINIKTDSGGAANVFNNIVINCDNVATKGSDYGVTIRSENGIVIEAADANAADNPTQIKMVANGGIDIGVDTALSPASHTVVAKTLIHGKLEIQTLYKASGSIDCSTHDVAFDQLKTTKLINNYTHAKSANTVSNGSSLVIIPGATLDNTNGTMYKIYVGAESGSTYIVHTAVAIKLGSGNFRVASTGQNASSGTNYGTITVTHSSSTTANGIEWTNNLGGDALVYATVQRIIESTDYP